jgi:hypothetical protein
MRVNGCRRGKEWVRRKMGDAQERERGERGRIGGGEREGDREKSINKRKEKWKQQTRSSLSDSAMRIRPASD